MFCVLFDEVNCDSPFGRVSRIVFPVDNSNDGLELIQKVFPEQIKLFAPLTETWIVRPRIRIELPNGIIAHLSNGADGNVHLRNVVRVTSSRSRTRFSRHQAKAVANLDSLSCFFSALGSGSGSNPYTPNNWVCYNFKSRWVIPTHYAIQTCGDGAGGRHLKSWLVEGSVDGESWIEIDRQEDRDELNARKVLRTFEVAKSEVCRFVRLTNSGRNYEGIDQIVISAFEIFGALIE
jgi:hypothetical protein